ncbi:MAG: chorismate-binding protein [Flavobacteriales bacterium]
MTAFRLTSDLSFALYRLPDDDSVKCIVHQSPAEGLVNSGFVLAPFLTDYPEVVIHAEILLENPHLEWVVDLPPMDLMVSGRADYLQKAAEYVAACKAKLNKVILSRKKQVIQENFHPLDFFYKLEKFYKSAFVYLCYTPQYGCWAGATPEHLLEVKSGKAKTVSLAGTQPSDAYFWSDKERDEQEWVSVYIRDVLQKRGLSFIETGPETIQAGKIAHLKSVFEFELPAGEVFPLAKALHPTPAVCGLPKETALRFIQEYEGYDRQLYTGYLGPFSTENTSLFVNLRCARLFDDGLELFVGGGITAASEPHKEWEETELKSKTLLDILEK